MGIRSTRIQLLYGTPRPRAVLNLLETGQKAHCSVNLTGIIIVVDIIIIGVILGVRVCAVHFDIVVIYFKFKFNTYSVSISCVNVAKMSTIIIIVISRYKEAQMDVDHGRFFFFFYAHL